jgi:PilZ domain
MVKRQIDMVGKSNTSTKGLNGRREDRLSLRYPVKLAKASGLTHNISASGVFFELDEDQAEGTEIQFTIELQTPGGPLNLVCQAQVVRVQKQDGKFGIAAKIINQEFQALTASTKIKSESNK